MERRKAITTAAAASLTLLAGAAGIALNSGIVGANGDRNVGQISPVNTTTAPPVIGSVDDPATSTLAAATPEVKPTDAQPVTTSAASAYQDDERHESEDDEERDESEDRDDRSGREGAERDEYEGADDDD